MTTAANLNKITAADIARATENDDIDAAIAPLQNIAGIDDGGVAAHCFSGFDWQNASHAEREEQIRDWLRTETSYCVTDGEDNFADVLDVLVTNDGACLYWQMPDAARAKAALASGTVTMVGDLLVHPAAIEIEKGMAYTMTKVTP